MKLGRREITRKMEGLADVRLAVQPFSLMASSREHQEPGLWAVWIGLMNAHVLGGGTNAAQGLLPRGILESLMWIPVALSAGFCEEVAFRGYLQKQFQAITGNAGWAVLFQAIIFGIGHLYEGVGQVARITMFGVLFGLLALWRKSLRPGMIAHAWSDIFGVIIFRGMR
jgi:membrane protease YdiL (CAAX protease family)